VSGAGKSCVGKALSEKFGLPFLDGDDLHPQSNIQKMSSGIPLNDDDRLPWLEAVRQQSFAKMNEQPHIFAACSALKRRYRDFLRDIPGTQVWFIYLKGSMRVIKERIKNRQEHFMKPSLLKSQFETLEEPNREEAGVISVNTDNMNIEETVNQIAHILQPILGRSSLFNLIGS
jgi:gluconokinase